MNRELYVGTMRWGKWGADLKVKEISEILEKCLADGLHTFDSADIYGAHTTEALLGDAFSALGAERTTYKLITKCGILYPCQETNYTTKSYDTSAEYIQASVNRALVNLKTNYLDELLIHRPSPLMHFASLAKVLKDLLASGKVRAVGVSNFSSDQFRQLNALIPLSTNQIELSLYEPKSILNDDLNVFQEFGIRPQAWSPLGGIFKENDERVKRIRDIRSKLEKKYDCELSQLALAWLWKHPSGIIPVIGSSKLENIYLAKKAMEIDLDLEDWFALLEASRGKRVA